MKHHPMAGFSVSLSGDNAGALRGYWEKLWDHHDANAEANPGRRVRHVHRQVRRLVAGRHQPAADLATHPGARPPHLARRRWARWEVRATDITPVRRRRQGTAPSSRTFAPGPPVAAPRFAARPRTAIRAPRLSRNKTTEDGSKEQRSALRAAVYRRDEPTVILPWQATANPFQAAPPERGTDAWHGGWRYAAAPR